MSRRLYDGGESYSYASDLLYLNQVMSWSSWVLGLFQLVFFVNFWITLFRGKKVENDNPWDATTLEWQTPTPPGHGNFTTPPVVYRDPYEYSVPGVEKGYLPQNQKLES